MARRTGIMVTALFLLGTFIPGKANLKTCTELDSGTESQMIAYLTQARQSGGNKQCIVSAIRRLSNKKSVGSVEVLTDFLDYKRPLTTEEQAGVWIRTKSPEELCPAVSALFSMGKEAVPGILRAITNTQPSTVKWDNAVYALMLIHRDDPIAGVGVLSSSAAASTGVEAGRLSLAASDAAKLCSEDLRGRCMEAVSRRRY